MRTHRRLSTGFTAVSVCVLSASFLAGCSAEDPGAGAGAGAGAGTTTAASEGPRTVTLRVTGTGWPTAEVAITADDTGSPIETKSLPWSTTIDYDSAATLWLFATFGYIPGRSTLGATLSCEVLVDGKPVSSLTAESGPSDNGEGIVQEHAVCSYTPGQ